MNIKSFMPSTKALIAWFVLIFVGNFLAARAGLPLVYAIGPVLIGIAILKRTGLLAKIPMLGNLPETFELGIAMTAFTGGLGAFMALPSVYKSMLTGTTTAASTGNGGAVLYNTAALTER